MSESYLIGALEHLPAAEITFDRYHIKAQLTKAVDEVRRAERAEHGQLLRHTRYLWLRNPRNLTDRQADRLAGLLRLPLKTGRAYRWMLSSTASMRSKTQTRPPPTCAAGNAARSAHAWGRSSTSPPSCASTGWASSQLRSSGGGGLSVLRFAQTPSQPVSPRRGRDVVIALLLGMLVTFSVQALLRLRRSIRVECSPCRTYPVDESTTEARD
jgi:hypothetical protein